MYDLVIRGGTVVDPGGTLRADVGIRGERIAAIGNDLAGERVIDAHGLLVIPGAVDPHVHLQMPLAGRVSTDTFASGTQAALCGGTTTVIDFVTPEPEQSMLDALAQRRQEADGVVAADYGLHMTVPTWHAADTPRLGEVSATVAAGCPTFKMYQAYAGMALDDAAHRAMTAVAGAGGRECCTARRGRCWRNCVARVEAGHTEPIWHAATRPARLEASAIHRAAEIADLAGCPLYVFHVGAKESVEQVRRARQRGVAIHAETCPQYLLLSAGRHLGGPDGELFVCAPPLRNEADQDALWVALARGDVDVVSTDHCPWLRAEKRQADFTLIPGGLPSIERGWRWFTIAALGRVAQPGEVGGVCCLRRTSDGLGCEGASGSRLWRGSRSFRPARHVRIDTDTLHEAAGWTPYAGMEVTGWPRTVLLRGRVVVEDERLVVMDAGRFVA